MAYTGSHIPPPLPGFALVTEYDDKPSRWRYLPVVVVSFLAIFLLRDVMQGHALIRLAVAERARTFDVQIDPDRLPAGVAEYPAVVTGKTTSGKLVSCTIHRMSFDEVPLCVPIPDRDVHATSANTFEAVSDRTTDVLAVHFTTPSPEKVVEALGLVPTQTALTASIAAAVVPPAKAKANPVVKDQKVKAEANPVAKDQKVKAADKKAPKDQRPAQPAPTYPFLTTLNLLNDHSFLAMFTDPQERTSQVAVQGKAKAKTKPTDKGRENTNDHPAAKDRDPHSER